MNIDQLNRSHTDVGSVFNRSGVEPVSNRSNTERFVPQSDDSGLHAASLLDRLTRDRAPVRTVGAHQLRAARTFRDAVRRDLENLLNTRYRCSSWPPALHELEQSLVNYGIPDFTGASFNDPNSQREFRRVIERAIQRFEPRLKRVKVTLRESGYARDRILHFRIDATLQVGRLSEAVAFETALDPTSNAFTVGTAPR